MPSKTQEWAHARQVLKITFQGAGITRCELQLDNHCWHNNGLSFAHSKKRGDIQGNELYEVVLACAYCHTVIEGWPKQKMTEIVRSTIAKRARQPLLPVQTL